MTKNKRDLLRVLYAPSDVIQAEVIAQHLDSHGIACEVRSYGETAFDGLFQSQKGWGVLRVGDADYAHAKLLLDEWLTAKPVGEALAESQPPKKDLDQPEPSPARHNRSSLLKAALLLSLIGNVAFLLFGFDGWLRRGRGYAGEIDRRSLDSVEAHLLLPKECSAHRKWLAEAFVSGAAIAEGWAKDKGYGKAIPQVGVNQIEVVPTRRALDARINELRRIAGKPWKSPADIPAALEAGVFVIIDADELQRMRETKRDLPEDWYSLVAIAMTRAIKEAYTASLPKPASRKPLVPPGPKWW